MSAAIRPACDCFFIACWVSELCPVKPGRALNDKVGFDILLMMMRLTRGGFKLLLRTIMGQRRCYFMMGCWWSNRLLVVLDLFVQPGIISGKLCWHLWLVATPADPADKRILFSFHSFCFHFLLQANIHYTSTPTTKDDTLSSVSVWMLNTLSIK